MRSSLFLILLSLVSFDYKWTFMACVRDASECFYSCGRGASNVRREDDVCDYSDYTQRYACYCGERQEKAEEPY